MKTPFSLIFIFILLLVIPDELKALDTEKIKLPGNRAEILLSFAPLVKKASPAVVNIYTKRVIKSRKSPFFNDPFFQQFFGDDLLRFDGPRNRIQSSLGSGVIVSGDGIVVTNNHVIRGADQIIVVLSNRREFSAKVILADERTDLAVLRVNTSGERLPSLKLRDSDNLKVGDLVLAIGNPFGVGQTVTSGIVSAVARAAAGVSDFSFFIQTDAAINPGNSGGALLGMDGRLVGINTAIYSRSGGSQGIGFAIPANMVERIIESALVGGRIVSPWLGASGQDVTSRLAENLGLKRPVGVLITKLYSGGPADRAGVIIGDIIVKINGLDVDTPAALRYRMATLRVGKTVVLEIIRNGVEKELKLSLVKPPEEPPRDTTRLIGKHPLNGAVIANISPALAEELSIYPLEQGVIVLKVFQQSSAIRLGLRPGDYITKINARRVSSVEEVRAVLAMPQQRWSLSVNRGGKVLSVTVR